MCLLKYLQLNCLTRIMLSEVLVQEIAVEFVTVASKYIYGLEYSRFSTKTVINPFVSHFGIIPRHCAFLWMNSNQQIHSINAYRKKKHLLWTLNLLQTNATQHQINGCRKADKKTIQKWVYIVLEVVGDLGVVSN